MSINFPTSLDSLPNPTSTDLLENAVAALDHDVQHSNVNDAIEALEAKVGINSSAVTTSHDYKLSGVTGSDKAVSKTGTETLTNKTLTAPQINFGSDTRGDIIVRNSSGVSSRFAIGTSGQILSANASGDPEWIANPAAADASTTVKGVVEIATIVEITAGTSTGATGATLAVPASAVGAVGASKIVQFNSSAQYPAADGSLITNVAPNDIYSVNADETLNTFYTFQVPFAPTSATVAPGWTLTGNVPNYSFDGAGSYVRVFDTGGSNSEAIAKIVGSGSTTNYSPAQSKILRYKQVVRVSDTSDRKGWGLCVAAANIHTAQTDTTNGEIRFILNGATLYAQNANGTATSTDISSGVTVTNWNTYEIVFTPGVSIKYYVNGTLKATHTTNLPTTGTLGLALGANANGRSVDVLPPVISLQS